jgi:diguanylate cyclase (GGDEF)-like protein
LTQPHTSAGRVPTELGYRYFVERLMRESRLPVDEQRTIRHQFHQVGVDLEQWMRLAASVLARTSQSAAVVTSLKTDLCRLRHLELISIQDALAMLIVVLEGGIVRQQILSLDEPINQDTLTQIANRRGFNSVAGHMLELCRRTGVSAELLFFDLDRFKGFNDEFGHATGDELLRHFAELLLKCFRSADVVARLGGDEFVVLMAGPGGDFDEALHRLERTAAAEPSETRRRLRWSVGRVRFDAGRHSSIDKLLADADAEMYRQKAVRRSAGE